jgi:hypothetical protein
MPRIFLFSLFFFFFSFFFFTWWLLGSEFRASCFLGRQKLYQSLKPLHQSFFVLSIFEMGSREMFVRAGFELRSS